MMIDTIELYILILFYVTLVLIQGQRNAREEKKPTSAEISYLFYLVHSMVKGENPTYVVSLKKLKTSNVAL